MKNLSDAVNRDKVTLFTATPYFISLFNVHVGYDTNKIGSFYIYAKCFIVKYNAVHCTMALRFHDLTSHLCYLFEMSSVFYWRLECCRIFFYLFEFYHSQKVRVSLYRVILAIRPISGTKGCTSPNFGGGTRAEAYEAQCGSRYHSVSNGYWTGVQREWLEMKSGFRISQVYHFRLWFCPWSEAKADGAPSLP